MRFSCLLPAVRVCPHNPTLGHMTCVHRAAEASSSINGGEDDLERRRRERREARLR